MTNNRRIALLLPTLNGGGAEKVCIKIAQGCIDAGVEVHLVVIIPHMDYEVPKGLTVHTLLDCAKRSSRLHSVQKKAALALSEYSSQVGGFDSIFANLLPAYAVAAMSGLNNVHYVVHNAVCPTLKQIGLRRPIKYLRARKALSYLKGNQVIAVSCGIKQELLSLSAFRPGNVEVIYNPLDIANIKKLAAYQPVDLPDEPYILFVGRTAKQKRIDRLLCAFGSIEKPVALLTLGASLKKYNKLISKLPSGKKIISLPFKQNPYAYIVNAQALILCSDFEGFGMVLAEALACGTPVISRNCPYGPNEILIHGLARYLVDSKDPKDIAKKIDTVLNETDYPFQDAQLERFDLAQCVERYLSLV